MKSFCLIIVFISLQVLAESSPLCEDLASYSCGPGSYQDATGIIKSNSEIQNILTSFSIRMKSFTQERFRKILGDPEHKGFRDLSISAFGLKSYPPCSSDKEFERTACNENILDGLNSLVHNHFLSDFSQFSFAFRTGSLGDLAAILDRKEYAGVLKEVEKKAVTEAKDPKIDQKIEKKIFPQLKRMILERIQALDIPDSDKKIIKDKVNSIRFAGSNCSDVQSNSSSKRYEGVAAQFLPNAFYDPQKKAAKYCSGLTSQSTSEFQIVATLVHELTHSIDPCQIVFGSEGKGFEYKNKKSLKKMQEEHPFKNVILCLRDKRSINAKNFTPRNKILEMEAPAMEGPGMSKSSSPSTSVQASYMSFEPPIFCGLDQIGESFSDWMAAEILPVYMEKNYQLNTEQYREGYGNALRMACWVSLKNEKALASIGQMGTHPLMMDRINKILLVNPRIRAQMGCSKKHKKNIYCDSEEYREEVSSRPQLGQTKSVSEPGGYSNQPSSPIFKGGVR